MDSSERPSFPERSPTDYRQIQPNSIASARPIVPGNGGNSCPVVPPPAPAGATNSADLPHVWWALVQLIRASNVSGLM